MTLGLVALVAAALVTALAVGIVAHELGHALAGAVVGFRIHRIQVGSGPPVLRFGLGQVRVSVHAGLGGGSTLCTTDRPGHYRLRHSIVLIGGPAASLALAVTAWSLLPGQGRTAGAFLGVAAVINLGLAVTNLWPQTVTGAGGAVLRSDGGQLVDTWTASDAEIDERVRTSDLGSVVAAFEDDDDDRATAIVDDLARTRGEDDRDVVFARIDLAIRARRWADVEPSVRQALEFDTDRVRLPKHHNSLAWALVMRGTADVLGEALEHATTAHELDPDDVSISHTLGAVRALLGLEGGRELLQAAEAALPEPDRAFHHLLVAAAAANASDLFSARRRLRASGSVEVPHRDEVTARIGALEAEHLLVHMTADEPERSPAALASTVIAVAGAEAPTIAQAVRAWLERTDPAEVDERVAEWDPALSPGGASGLAQLCSHLG